MDINKWTLLRFAGSIIRVAPVSLLSKPPDLPIVPSLNTSDPVTVIEEEQRSPQYDKPTNDETTAHQHKELVRELLLLEAHLNQKCIIADKPCDCCFKHATTIEGLAIESVSINPDMAPEYQNITHAAKEVQQKCHQDTVIEGTYESEYPALANSIRMARKPLHCSKPLVTPC